MSQSPYRYHAFISYSHSADASFASRFQAALQGFARPWYRMRALRVFRDQTNLAANPDLWGTIVAALDNSEFLLYLASPAAARSPWVQKELEYWLDHRDLDSLILVASEGGLEWDDDAGDFDWKRTNVLPAALRGRFGREPLFVDFRKLKREQLSLRDPKFLDSVATVAATLHKRSKDEIFGEDVRQHRRTIRLAICTSIILLALTIAASLFGVLSWLRGDALRVAIGEVREQRDLAELQTRNVTARLLAAESRSALEQYPQRSVLLAAEAVRATKPDEPHVLAAEQALRDALAAVDGFGLVGHTDKVTAATITRDGHWAVTAGWDGAIRVWDLQAVNHQNETAVFRHESGGPIEFLEVSDDGQWLYNLYGARLYRRKFDIASPSTPAVVFGSYINDVEISPDRRWCVTGGRKAQLWDLNQPDFHESPINLEGHDEEVVAVAFGDGGRRVVTADKKGTVFLWNVPVTSPAERLQTLDANPRLELKSIAFSSNGRWIATGDNDGELNLWSHDPATSKWSPINVEGHQYDATQLAFTGDSTRLVSGGKDNVVRVLTLPDGEMQLTSVVLTGHTGFVTSFVIGPQDRWLATTSQDGTVRLWDLQARDPTESARTLGGHDGWVEGIATDPEGRWLITASWDGTARVWELAPDVKTDYPLAFRCDAGSFSSAALSPSERYLFAFGELPGWFGGGHGTIRVWDLANPGRSPAKLDGHKSNVRSHAFTSDDALIVTGSSDHTARIWHREDDRWTTNPVTLDLASMAVMNLAISPDDRWLVTGSMGGMARLWDLNRRDEPEFAQTAIKLTERIGDSVGRCLVGFSADGRWLAVACDEVGWVWDMTQVESEEFESSGIRLKHRRNVDQLRFMPDDRGLFTLAGTQIYRWTLPSKSKSPEAMSFSDWIDDLLITQDGRWLIASARDYPPELRLWHPDSEAFTDPLYVLRGHGREPTSMSTRRDNSLLATTGGFDNTVRLWSLDGSQPAEKFVFYLGEAGYAHLALFSWDNRRLFASENEQVRCWDLERADPTEDSIFFRGPYKVGNATTIDRDSRWLVTIGEDAVRLWTLDKDELLQIAQLSIGRNLTLTEWQAVFRNEPYRKTFDSLPVHRDVVRAKIEQARKAVQAGDRKGAERLYCEVVAWGMEQDDVWLCNEVSANGCDDGFAGVVLNASDHAVGLVPDNRTLRRQRGIARGLTGNLKGALDDLRSDLDRYFDEDRQELERWIKKLEQGHELTTDDL
jgi:WD40 repeat protein